MMAALSASSCEPFSHVVPITLPITLRCSGSAVHLPAFLSEWRSLSGT